MVKRLLSSIKNNKLKSSKLYDFLKYKMDKYIGVFILTSMMYGLSLARYYYRNDDNMIYMIIFCGFLYIYNFLKSSSYYYSLE